MNSQKVQKPNPAADEIKVFYDRHPYPPPVTDLDRYRRLRQDWARLRTDYHLLWPTTPYREEQAVLVAGCGTSQAAKHALRQPAARVVGIDVSSTSLRHTQKLKRKYNLANLDIHQLPIEQVHELEGRFDQIICTGVLHHLTNPDAALRALRAVLKTNGAMHLMVYAPYGRTGITMLQDYCRRLGIGTSEKEIRDLVAVLKTLPQGHPLEHLLHQTPDFQRADALADALLNPRERAYSVPQLLDYIERNDLTFGRWVRQAPYLPHCGALAKTPHGPRLAQLPAAAQYAAVELFRGTMLRHSVIVYRNDRPDDSQSIRFDDEDWSGYVPLRQPYTICVEQRLPPGAAGVLINQSHTYPDLILPINATEKRLFEAIDGKRTIAEIISGTESRKNDHQHRERARSLFERLWWYDQVVFDASQPSPKNKTNPAKLQEKLS
jgi:2-polyprenyl-3-methyl-5-hydroxy-6-metoxy-1,4-benzoquinol methylase